MRRPRGYVGTNHVTLGSDVLAVFRALERITGGGPRLLTQLLGEAGLSSLEHIDAATWYPIERLLSLMDTIEKKVGRYGLMRVGRTVFEMSHEGRVTLTSARDVVYGIDGMYHHANRGEGIGGWAVKRFEPGVAELDKNTPHHCAMEEGLLTQALQTLGIPALVSQRECFRQGAGSCVFIVESAVHDARWTG